jgi:endonuclease YncB( thermonuclease family)
MPAPPLGITARAIVDRVIDGDTMIVMLQIPVSVRMLDCWAAEITGLEKPEGIKAKNLLEHFAPVGSQVVVNVPTTDANALGGVLTFGRVLGEIYRRNEDGTCENESLSELMVAAGMATKEKTR